MTPLDPPPHEEKLITVLRRMAERALSVRPIRCGFTRLWRVRVAPEACSEIPPDRADYGHARERWFALDPTRLGPYARQKWPHGELIHVDLADELVCAFRVSAYEILPPETKKDNPAAYSFDPENEFFLPASTAAKAVKIGCVRTAFLASGRDIPNLNKPSVHTPFFHLAKPAPALL